MFEETLEGIPVEELTDLLEKTDARIVRLALKDEDDADLAIFLLALEHASRTLAKHASQILVDLPPAKQTTVAENAATTEIATSERVQEIYTRLTERIVTAAKHTTVFGDGASNLVRLMSQMKIDEQNRLLESLAERQPDLVNQIHEQIFTFKDLATLNDSAVRAILQVLDASTIALALHDAPSTIRDKSLRNLSAESAADVETKMGQLTFKQTQVADTAKQSIVSLIRSFAAKGMIKIDREFDGAIEV